MPGCARAFEMPTAHSVIPALVPPRMLTRAIAAWTSANQVAVICGPAVGGFIYAVKPVAVSMLCTAFFLASVTLVSLMRVRSRS
jgi:MFS family permease